MEFERFEQLLHCATVEELHAATGRAVQDLGYEHFLYAVQVNTSLTRPYQFIFSGFPKDWRAHYNERGYQGIDPTIRHCMQRVVPMVWDDRHFAGREAARMRGEAREFGLVNGASLAVHGSRGELAMLSLTNSPRSAAARQAVTRSLGEAQLLACYLHEAVQEIVLSKEVLPLKRAKLTERERECLLWASEGKTSWETATILNVSERTVVFHVQNAARKMGATNRRQAVARALTMGLIQP